MSNTIVKAMKAFIFVVALTCIVFLTTFNPSDSLDFLTMVIVYAIVALLLICCVLCYSMLNSVDKRNKEFENYLKCRKSGKKF